MPNQIDDRLIPYYDEMPERPVFIRGGSPKRKKRQSKRRIRLRKQPSSEAIKRGYIARKVNEAVNDLDLVKWLVRYVPTFLAGMGFKSLIDMIVNKTKNKQDLSKIDFADMIKEVLKAVK
jgi:hypothetical protein